MPSDYALYLESGPKRRKTMVHVLDLLGCVAVGPTTEEALEATPEAIRAYLRFLKRCGEDVDIDAPFSTHVDEHVTEGSWLGNGSPYLMFRPDGDAVTAEDIARNTRRFHEMRELLATWCAQQTPETLEAGTDVGRANRAVVLHVLSAAGSYASPLVGGIPGNSKVVTATERGQLTLPDGLRQSEALISDALRATTERQRSEVVTRGQITRSLRKAIRRTLEHDWEHIAELARRPGGPVLSAD
jgi:predicted RNase H-like HicB family nuclease